MRSATWRTLIATATTLAIVFTAAAVTAPASAARPAVGLSPVSYQIDANTAPKFHVAVYNKPSGAVAYLQRQYGSAAVWKNVVKLKTTHGVITAPKIAMGRYVYRLHLSGKHGGLADSAVKGVFGYGAVRIETLCNSRDNGSASCYDQKQTAQVGSRLFAYTVDAYTGDYPNFTQNIYIGRNSCRYLSLDYADDSGTDAGSYLQVTQTASDTRTAYVPSGQVGHAVFPLDGGPFSLNSSSNGDGSVGFIGAASCWTISGTR